MSPSANPEHETADTICHGLTVLPGEPQEELDELWNRLIGEWQPAGVLEEECLRILAAALWRIRHLGTFRRAERALDQYGRYKDREEARTSLTYKTALKGQMIVERLQDKIEAHKNGTAPIVEPIKQHNELIKLALEVFGTETVQKLVAKAAKEEAETEVDIALAELRNVTLARLMKEIEASSRLEEVIDRTYERLVKLQADRSRKAQQEQTRRTQQRLAIFRCAT